ncbi:hypothetical protein [Vreelandella sp. V005]|uniref:hypothetical protein n=1 Tax=Vreelandella sp. V005 TaxID=3459608 RepID=UPI0040445507
MARPLPFLPPFPPPPWPVPPPLLGVAEEGVAEEEVLPVLLAVGFVALAPVLKVLLGEAALGEVAAVLLLLDALEAVDDDLSAGFASACVPVVAVLFSELFSEWLSGELAAGEPVL